MIFDSKFINNRLYLFLDFNYEFGSFKNSKTDIKKMIKNYLKNHKMLFSSIFISLVSSGILIGNYYYDSNSNNIIELNSKFLNKVTSNENLNSNNFFDISVEKLSINEKNSVENFDKVDNLNNSEKNSVENFHEINNDVQNLNSSENNAVENFSSEVLNNNENVSEMNNQEVENNIDENFYQNFDNNIVNSINVTINRSNGSVINLELEEYLVGVVGSEMPASFNEQALMSQAIIARTYALKALQNGKTLTDTSSTQTYKDNGELRALWGGSFDYYYSKVLNAVNSTNGLYLSYGGNYIEAVYHSTSNGTTESSFNVWGNYYPYLVSVDSLYDSSNKSFEMDKFFSYEDLSSIFQYNINFDTNFEVLSKTSGNRVENFKVGENVYNGVYIRSLLGLRSTDFVFNKSEVGVTITTRGYGHGVGLSQYGANGMANNGYSFYDILYHYYPNVEIVHL